MRRKRNSYAYFELALKYLPLAGNIHETIYTPYVCIYTHDMIPTHLILAPGEYFKARIVHEFEVKKNKYPFVYVYIV